MHEDEWSMGWCMVYGLVYGLWMLYGVWLCMAVYCVWVMAGMNVWDGYGYGLWVWTVLEWIRDVMWVRVQVQTLRWWVWVWQWEYRTRLDCAFLRAQYLRLVVVEYPEIQIAFVLPAQDEYFILCVRGQHNLDNLDKI